MRRLALGFVLSLLVANPALAAPITMFFSSGSADVTATRTSDNSLVVDIQDLALGGLYVTFDADAPSLMDFSITVPMSGAISTLQPWGGFDTFVIESASITPGAAYTSTFVTQTSPTMFSFLVGPVDVVGVYSAYNSAGGPASGVSNVPVPFQGGSFLNGTIDTDNMTLELLGITLTQLPGFFFGESDNLIVKADITWTGVAPEPSAPVLFMVGALVVGFVRRR